MSRERWAGTVRSGALRESGPPGSRPVKELTDLPFEFIQRGQHLIRDPVQAAFASRTNWPSPRSRRKSTAAMSQHAAS